VGVRPCSQVLVQEPLQLRSKPLLVLLSRQRREIFARLPDVEYLADETLQDLGPFLVGDRVLLEGVQEVDQLDLDCGKEFLDAVHERWVDRDVVVADVVWVEEDVDEDRVVRRVDEVRVGHRLEVAFQLREEEGDTVFIDWECVEVFQEVRRFLHVLLCVDLQHAV